MLTFMKMKKTYTILIAEDEITSAQYLKELLEDEGYKISAIVSRGLDAIIMAQEKKPDLILMDVILKDNISGCEAAIKINQENPDIAIIFLTAHCQKEMVDFAKVSNAHAYLMKPYRDEEILTNISIVLSKVKKQSLIKQVSLIKLKNNFYYDIQTSTLSKAGNQIHLTPVKSKLVEILVKHLNKSLSHAFICQYVWGEYRDTSTLRSLVYRTKQSTKEELISNINGVGYSITSK